MLYSFRHFSTAAAAASEESRKACRKGK
jgi:hypothetical protein